MKNEVRVWRMISGEEIIGQEMHSLPKGGDLTIKNPIIIQVIQSKAGKAEMGMAPLTPLQKKGTDGHKYLTVARDKIVFSYIPVDELTNNFNQMNGGLITKTTQFLTE